METYGTAKMAKTSKYWIKDLQVLDSSEVGEGPSLELLLLETAPFSRAGYELSLRFGRNH